MLKYREHFWKERKRPLTVASSRSMPIYSTGSPPCAVWVLFTYICYYIIIVNHHGKTGKNGLGDNGKQGR